MPQTYGRQPLSPVVGNSIQLSADLDRALWHPIGITLDWTTITAVSGADVTLPDNNVVKIGQKGLRYGQVLCKITSGGSAGLWGPWDTAATDGRQTLKRGNCVLLNETLLENGPIPGLLTGPTSHPAVLDGGEIWQARLLDSTQTNPLAPTGPTYAALEAVLVGLQYVI